MWRVVLLLTGPKSRLESPRDRSLVLCYLFIIYVNDIGNALSSHTILFADDCTIYRQIKNNQDTIEIQSNISNLYLWSCKWQLNLNLSKCNALCISNKKSKPPLSYFINNTPLEWVDSTTYLGVKINQKLSWCAHINDITIKANRVLGLLRRSLRECSSEAKTRAYTALVQPHTEYCAPVWNPLGAVLAFSIIALINSTKLFMLLSHIFL